MFQGCSAAVWSTFPTAATRAQTPPCSLVLIHHHPLSHRPYHPPHPLPHTAHRATSRARNTAPRYSSLVDIASSAPQGSGIPAPTRNRQTIVGVARSAANALSSSSDRLSVYITTPLTPGTTSHPQKPRTSLCCNGPCFRGHREANPVVARAPGRLHWPSAAVRLGQYPTLRSRKKQLQGRFPTGSRNPLAFLTTEEHTCSPSADAIYFGPACFSLTLVRGVGTKTKTPWTSVL